MKVLNPTFLKSAMKPEDFPRDGRPEIAFVGRSNVGKSSLINRLLGRKGLAKTSRTPGKTQTINFFDIDGRLYFVDLPGYGYAKVPLSQKERWNQAMTGYLSERKPLRLVILLVDSRHAPTEKDIEMLELLDWAEVRTLLVATKIDKLTQSQRARNLQSIREALNLDQDALLIPFSSTTGEGVRPVWDIIEQGTASP